MGLGLSQTGFLVGLIALAIPVIIHLMFRQQPRAASLGSVRFLAEILGRHRGRRKVIRRMLLALRMVCLALLVMLFARPFVAETGDASNAPFTAVLIDRSGSMQLRSGDHSLLTEAVQQTREMIERDPRTHFEVALFDHQVVPLGAGTDSSAGCDSQLASRGKLLADLDAAAATSGATDYAAALHWAHDVCSKAPSNRKTVHVFTDLQQSGLDWSEVQAMPAKVQVQLRDLGRDLPNNLALISARPSRMVIRPGEKTTVRVSVLNAGPFTLEDVVVVLNLQNEKRRVTNVSVSNWSATQSSRSNLNCRTWPLDYGRARRFSRRSTI